MLQSEYIDQQLLYWLTLVYQITVVFLSLYKNIHFWFIEEPKTCIRVNDHLCGLCLRGDESRLCTHLSPKCQLWSLTVQGKGWKYCAVPLSVMISHCKLLIADPISTLLQTKTAAPTGINISNNSDECKCGGLQPCCKALQYWSAYVMWEQTWFCTPTLSAVE